MSGAFAPRVFVVGMLDESELDEEIMELETDVGMPLGVLGSDEAKVRTSAI